MFYPSHCGLCFYDDSLLYNADRPKPVNGIHFITGSCMAASTSETRKLSITGILTEIAHWILSKNMQNTLTCLAKTSITSISVAVIWVVNIQLAHLCWQFTCNAEEVCGSRNKKKTLDSRKNMRNERHCGKCCLWRWSDYNAVHTIKRVFKSIYCRLYCLSEKTARKNEWPTAACTRPHWSRHTSRWGDLDIVSRSTSNDLRHCAKTCLAICKLNYIRKSLSVFLVSLFASIDAFGMTK